jgi:hypothetical protein
MARHLAVLACMAALCVASASAASLGHASGASMLKLRSNLKTERMGRLTAPKSTDAQYFTTLAEDGEEVLCLRMR